MRLRDETTEIFENTKACEELCVENVENNESNEQELPVEDNEPDVPKKKKTGVIILLIFLVVSVILIGVFYSYKRYTESPKYRYKIANEYLEHKEYKKAAIVFSQIKDKYKSEELLIHCNRMLLNEYIDENGNDGTFGKYVVCDTLPDETKIYAGDDDTFVIETHLTGGTDNNSRDRIDNIYRIYVPSKGDEAKCEVDFEAELYITIFGVTSGNMGGTRTGEGTIKISEFNRKSGVNVDYDTYHNAAIDMGVVSNLVDDVKQYLDKGDLGISMKDLGFSSIE